MHGLGGIGTTSIAATAYHTNADLFPDKGILVALSTEDDEEIPAGVALRSALVQLGMPENEVPSEDADRAAAFQNKVAGKRMLVVLERALTVAQVKRFVPNSQSCSLLVTSRVRIRELYKHGFRFVPVDRLAQRYWTELFQDLLVRAGQSVDESLLRPVVEACDGHPEAMVTVAGQLVDRSRPRAERFLRQFAEHGFGAVDDTARAAVWRSLDFAVDALRQADADAYRLLALLPGEDFTAPVAAVLLDRSLDDAQDTVDRLVDANLLACDEDGGRYPVPPVRARARQDARGVEPGGAAACARVVPGGGRRVRPHALRSLAGEPALRTDRARR